MGLNAALNRMLYFPPALPSGDAMLHLTVERVIERDIATPEELFLGEARDGLGGVQWCSAIYCGEHVRPVHMYSPFDYDRLCTHMYTYNMYI